ncbi:UNVERIFIED_CONTAM: hypothetical protein H355_002498, partial [Colinus virginianus]
PPPQFPPPPGAPRKAAPVSAAPRAGKGGCGAAPPAPAGGGHRRRAAWDLKGQVSDLRAALGKQKERALRLDGENRQLRERLRELQEEMREKERSGEEMEGRVRTLSTELEKQRQESEQRGRELEELREESRELAARLETTEAQLQQSKAALAQSESEATELRLRAESQARRLREQEELYGVEVAELRARTQSQSQRLREQEERQHALEMERRRLHNAVQELKSALDGYHVCIFAYGQTGSGKTYTMEGPDALDPERRGMIPRAVHQIFQGAQELAEKGWQYRFSASFLEIYNESLRDLLGARPERGELEIRRVSSASEELHVPNLRCVPVESEDEVRKPPKMAPKSHAVTPKSFIPIPRASHSSSATQNPGLTWPMCVPIPWLQWHRLPYGTVGSHSRPSWPPTCAPCCREPALAGGSDSTVSRGPSQPLRFPDPPPQVLQLLQTATAKRSVARTALNDHSSRSHSIFQLRIDGTNAARELRCSSVLSLVDLAGSERLDKSQSQGKRLRETQAINTSLSSLGLVIMALAKKEPHVPYRNSKLTYLLQNSLGGSAKMLMFVNISPLEENFAESLNSLRFASKGNIRVFCRVRPLLASEEGMQKGMEHLRFPPQDNKTLVLLREEE